MELCAECTEAMPLIALEEEPKGNGAYLLMVAPVALAVEEMWRDMSTLLLTNGGDSRVVAELGETGDAA